MEKDRGERERARGEIEKKGEKEREGGWIGRINTDNESLWLIQIQMKRYIIFPDLALKN